MRIFLKIVVILVILASAGFITKKLIETKPEAKRKPISIGAPLVEVISAEAREEQIHIVAMGTVVPAREVVIQPQVSGHVVEISPELVPGGRFKAGEMLLRIDDRDYKIVVEQRKAEIAKALVELKTEKQRQFIAKQEWELLGSEITTSQEGRELALRKPQIENVKAALESARSALEKAKLDVERTVIKASFNGFVKEKSVEVGQYVTPGTKLLTFAGTDEFWIQISVPVNRLPWIAVPGVNAEKGAFVKVIEEHNDSRTHIVRQGRVVRLLGDLDPVGRMARLLVAVEDPFGLSHSQTETEEQAKTQTETDAEPFSDSHLQPGNEMNSIPLLLGAYVSVEIEGPVLSDVFSVPRKAFREGNTVWILENKDTLSIKSVEVVWRRKEDVLVRGEVKSGDQIITSRISAPVQGMSVRVAENGLTDSGPEDTPPIPIKN